MLWKNKYRVYWCDLCQCVSITCTACLHGSCMGGGCNKCGEDFTWFIKNGEAEFADKIEELKAETSKRRTNNKLLEQIFGEKYK